MKTIKKFYVEGNEIYFGLQQMRYKQDDTTIVQAKGYFAYRNGEARDSVIEKSKWYEFPLENMKYWKEIVD